jgi:hypothetical protein
MPESNGTYATGGFDGKGKRHKGEHRAPSVFAKMTGKKDKKTEKGNGK